MTDPAKIELHDALLKEMSIDYNAKAVTVGIEYYRGEQAKKRVGARIVFERVASLSQIGSFNALSKNAFAGNISYWVPASKMGTTYIYMTGGCIAIEAGRLRFEHT